MDLMQEINNAADNYTPPVQEDVRSERLLKSMTPPTKHKDKKPGDKLVKKAKEFSIKNFFHSAKK